MRYYFSALIAILFTLQSTAQLSLPDSIAKTDFLNGQKQVSQSFNSYFNSHIAELYGANERTFVHILDSLYEAFHQPLIKLQQQHPAIGEAFITEQSIDLQYTFAKFLLDYPPVHKRITGATITLSNPTRQRIQGLAISTPQYLKYPAFVNYLQSMLEQETDAALQNNRKKYKHSDNQRLDAGLQTIEWLFKNPVIKNRMRYELLAYHINNYGVKNIGRQIQAFSKSNSDQSFQTTIDSLYQDGMEGRKGHVIEVYKTVDQFTLDLHIFQPAPDNQKHPTIVFFHGGGWSEGMPDWSFYSCAAYAKKGWVAVAVEYRLRNRHGNLPPQAMADGKSAIRYLRTHADRLRIDTGKIVASGNSAGASLALTLAVIDTLDEKSEDLRISSVPNAVMLNSVSTDLTQGDFWQQYIKDKQFLKRISPLHQVRKNLPPILIIQGSNDNNVPLQPVENFSVRMLAAGNECELDILEGAGHFLWYDRRYSGMVNDYRYGFLKRLGYEK